MVIYLIKCVKKKFHLQGRKCEHKSLCVVTLQRYCWLQLVLVRETVETVVKLFEHFGEI